MHTQLSWFKRTLYHFLLDILEVYYEQRRAWTRLRCPRCATPASSPDACYCEACGCALSGEPERHTAPITLAGTPRGHALAHSLDAHHEPITEAHRIVRKARLRPF